MFTGSGSTWTQNTEVSDPAEVTANTAGQPCYYYFGTPLCTASDSFGFDVAFVGSSVVATAPYDFQGYPNYANGAAFVIPKKGSTWPSTSPTKLVANFGEPGDYLGYVGLTTIGKHIIVVGAPYAANGGLYFYQN